MTTAAIYARVSDPKQESNYSIGTQLDGCRDYAKRNGITVIEELSDVHTGTVLSRPAFDRLKGMAGKVDTVIVYVQDRLGRADELDTWNMIRSFQDKGTQVHTVDTGFIDSSDFLKSIGMLFKARAAKEESQKIGERSTRGKKARARAGKVLACTVTKYGYDYDREKGCLLINPVEAEIVKQVYTWYVIGDESKKRLGSGQIARRLTEMCIPTKHDSAGYKKAKKGYGVWGQSSVLRILRDEVYAGTWYYNRNGKGKSRTTRIQKPRSEWIAVSVPAIVSRDVWEAAQRFGKENRRNPVHHWASGHLLQGRLYCAKCGYLMRSRGDYRTRAKTPFYTCHGQLALYAPDGKTPSCRGTFNQQTIDDLVWNALAEKLKRPGLLIAELRQRQADKEAALQPDRDYLERCQDELGKLDAERERWTLLYAHGKHDLDWLDNQLSQIDERRIELEAKIADLESRLKEANVEELEPGQVERLCAELSGNIDHATFAQKRRVLELLKIKAHLHRGEVDAGAFVTKRDKAGHYQGNFYDDKEATITLTGYIPTMRIPATIGNTLDLQYVDDSALPFSITIKLSKAA